MEAAPYLHALGAAVQRGDDGRKLFLANLGAKRIERPLQFERRERAEAAVNVARHIRRGRRPVSGQSFKTAVSLTSPRKNANSWNAQGGTNPRVALRQVESLVATFFVRSTKPATGGQITFSVEGGPKYDRLTWQDIKISNQWKKIMVPFQSKGAYGPEKWQVTFKMGLLAQTVQIAIFQLLTST